MKNYKLVSLFIACLFVSSLYGQAVPIGHWTFDEGSGTTATDVSGNGNDGIIHGAVYTDDTPGGNGFALEFSGPDAVHIGDPEILKIEDGDITISAWIFFSTLRRQDFSNICVKGHSDASDGEIVLRVNIRENLYQISSYDGGPDHCASTDVGLDDYDKWIHLTGTYTAADQTWRIYKNGELAGEGPDETGPVPVEDNGWAIGAKCRQPASYPTKSYPTERHFVGKIDDVRIYNVALTAEDVLAIYNETFTAVEPRAPDQPTHFDLSQNFPNPFNPTTNIEFLLVKSGYTIIQVFNLMGELVETLVDKNLQAGRHQVHFSAGHLSSGVYFYKITSGDFSKVKKMILLK